MAISLEDIRDYEPEPLLDPGLYTLRVGPEPRIITKELSEGGEKHSLLCNCEVVEGSTQSDGKDPEGREVSIFVQLDNYESVESPRGRKFLKKQCYDFLTAVGVDVSAGEFDPDAIVGAEFQATCKIGSDQNGEPQENWSNYKAY